MSHVEREFLTLKQASVVFSSSISSIRSLIKTGVLGRYRLGRRVLVRREEMIAYLSAPRAEVASDSPSRVDAILRRVQ